MKLTVVSFFLSPAFPPSFFPSSLLPSLPIILPPLHRTPPKLTRPASANAHDKDTADLTQKRDQHQKDSLDKQKQGKGEWKPELASDSEQAVAGEKSEMSMKEMQEMGQKKGESENKR